MAHLRLLIVLSTMLFLVSCEKDPDEPLKTSSPARQALESGVNNNVKL